MRLVFISFSVHWAYSVCGVDVVTIVVGVTSVPPDREVNHPLKMYSSQDIVANSP